MMKIFTTRTVLKKFPQGPSLHRGYALLELLFYVAFFTVLILVVINAIITMTRSFRENTIQNEWIQNGVSMERISREIKQAYSINSISVSSLKLNTKDSGGANKTAEFLLSGTDIQFLENDILTGNLNTPNISITDLIFTQINTAKGVAVKVSLSFKSKNDIQNRVQNFYDSIVLRGSY